MMIKNVFDVISNYLADMKIKQKLLLSYFVLIIIPLGLLTYLSSNLVATTVQDQTIKATKQVFEQTSSYLSFMVNNTVNTMKLIISDNNNPGSTHGYTIGEILGRGLDLENYAIPQQMEDMNRLSRTLKNLKNNADIKDMDKISKTIKNKAEINPIRLYVRDGLIYSDENINFYNMDLAKKTEWYKKMISINKSINWFPSMYFNTPGIDEPKVISAVQFFKNPLKLNENIAIVRIGILQEDIDNIITEANITSTGVTYLVNKDMEIISSSISQNAIQLSTLKKYYKVEQEDNWDTFNIDKQNVIIATKDISNTDWKLVSVIPVGELLSSSKIMRNFMLVYMIFIGIIAYLLAFFISNSSTKRIAQIIRRMKKVQNGDLDVIITKHGKDEIGEMVEDFNFMIKRISILIDEQYRSGQELKSAELKALQAQINPHFLYNTLDLINWMAIKNKVPEISYMIQVLAKFYKLSLSKGRDIVTIGDEILHVATYIQIQNKRFDEAINLEIDVNEELLEYKILKILLQPIVENSILHGILQKSSKSGTIKISGELEDDKITLIIKDDGVGMTVEQVNKIFSLENSDQLNGYGIKNINERIKLYFGEQYGLVYKSELNIGTTVEIKIPAVFT
jgi:two-component system, sensor histidine kinase YesM